MIILISQLIISLICIRPVIAFQPIAAASFIEKSSSYKVSDIEKCPSDFSAGVSSGLALSSVSKTTASGSTNDTTTTASISLSDGIFLLDTDSDYEAFYLNVTIDNEVLPLLIDTASPYIWVYGSDCSSDGCSGKELFTATQSSSTSTFELEYTSSTASGYISEVDLTINDELAVQNFNVGIATVVPDIFADYSISGVFGLPSQDESTLNGLQNLVEVLHDAGSIDKELFTLMLNNGSTNYNGILTIGKIIDPFYEGDFYYADNIDNDQNYWKIGVDSVYIDDYQVVFNNTQTINGTESNTSRLAVVDSGTTIMVANKADAAKLHSFFDASVTDGTNFAILCNETKQISFEVGGANFSIGPTSYIGTAYPESSMYYGYCVSNFQGLDIDDEGSWIFGGLFLKTVYTVFNYEKSAVGFAVKNYDDVEIVTESVTSTVTAAVEEVSAASAAATTASTGEAAVSSVAAVAVTGSSSAASSLTTVTTAASSSGSSNSSSSSNTTSSYSANAGIAYTGCNSLILTSLSILLSLIMI